VRDSLKTRFLLIRSNTKGSIERKQACSMVPRVGLEPTRYCYQRILSPLRLPFRHPGTGKSISAQLSVVRRLSLAIRFNLCHNKDSARHVCCPFVSNAEEEGIYPMAKKGEVREIIRLVCTEDGKSYYTTTKNKRNTPDRLELMKFNSKLRKYTLHREKK
jgi:large subunit ribosomal protein L33